MKFTDSISLTGYQETQAETSARLINAGATVSNTSDATEFGDIWTLRNEAYERAFGGESLGVVFWSDVSTRFWRMVLH